MHRGIHRSTTTLALLIALAVGMSAAPAAAATRKEIDRKATAALKILYAKTPAAKALGEKAKAILIFPDIVKAGFVVGGQYGEGALRVGGRTEGYYNTVAGSFGLQAGAQKFGYALFFMTDSAVDYLRKSSGWELGVGPTIVVVDAGMAGSLTTSTAQSDIYAFFFDQKGLMAGLGLQGSKITRIEPKK